MSRLPTKNVNYTRIGGAEGVFAGVGGGLDEVAGRGEGQDAGGDGQGVGKVVGSEEDGHSGLSGQVFKGRKEQLPLLGVQIPGGVVQEKEFHLLTKGQGYAELDPVHGIQILPLTFRLETQQVQGAIYALIFAKKQRPAKGD